MASLLTWPVKKNVTGAALADNAKIREPKRRRLRVDINRRPTESKPSRARYGRQEDGVTFVWPGSRPKFIAGRFRPLRAKPRESPGRLRWSETFFECSWLNSWVMLARPPFAFNSGHLSEILSFPVLLQTQDFIADVSTQSRKFRFPAKVQSLGFR